MKIFYSYQESSGLTVFESKNGTEQEIKAFTISLKSQNLKNLIIYDNENDYNLIKNMDA